MNMNEDKEKEKPTDKHSYELGRKNAFASILSIATAAEWDKSRAFIDALYKNESDDLLWVLYRDWKSAHEMVNAIAYIASGSSKAKLEEGRSKIRDWEQ